MRARLPSGRWHARTRRSTPGRSSALKSSRRIASARSAVYVMMRCGGSPGAAGSGAAGCEWAGRGGQRRTCADCARRGRTARAGVMYVLGRKPPCAPSDVCAPVSMTQNAGEREGEARTALERPQRTAPSRPRLRRRLLHRAEQIERAEAVERERGPAQAGMRASAARAGRRAARRRADRDESSSTCVPGSAVRQREQWSACRVRESESGASGASGAGSAAAAASASGMAMHADRAESGEQGELRGCTARATRFTRVDSGSPQS
jgi:hypothetical protein